MPRLLEEIEWASPVLPKPSDPAWAEELVRRTGQPSPSLLYAAPSPWLREGLVGAVTLEFRELPMPLALLVLLVTSQENACRYCYGTAKQYLSLQGISKERIDEVERDVKVASADEKEHAVLQFARNLSRSSPRPSRKEVDRLLALGYSQTAVEEMAVGIVFACLVNRYSTFLAVPLSDDEGADKPGSVSRWLASLLGRFRKPPAPNAKNGGESPSGGPYDALLDLVSKTLAGPTLARMLEGATHSEVLAPRTVAWMFATVAAALDCGLCLEASKRMLVDEGIDGARIDPVLTSLAGQELDSTECVLLPWTRETVHYQTEMIQAKTHDLAARVEPRVLLEAVGVASLANACSRLSLLKQ